GLQTRAVRVDDGWRIRGQKVWTSAAQYSRLGLLIARTDPSLPKHAGLTMFLIDMEQPGVTVRPLRQMTGDAHFNEVFFDDARVPAENLIGEVDGGWRVAITTLMNERLAIGGGGADMGVSVETLTRFAAKRLGALPADEQALVREKLGRAHVLAMAQRYTGYRRLTALSQGRMPGPEASVGKLSLVTLGQLTAEIGMSLLGDDAAFGADAGGGPAAMRAMLDGAPAPDIGDELAAVGFLGVLIDDERGGSALAVLDLAVVAEEAGRTLSTAPLVGAAGWAASLLRSCEGEVASAVLRELASGTQRIAVVEEDGAPVIGAHDATAFLAVGDGDLVVSARDAAEITDQRQMDPTRGLARVRVSRGKPLGRVAPEEVERARHVAEVTLAAEDLGTAARCLDMAVDYAKQRVAFGRPIGS